MKGLYWIVLLLAILFISATVLKSKAEGYRNITPELVSKSISSGEKDLLILDVRTEREYKDGHIKDARLIPLQTLPERLSEIGDYRSKEIIVYCAVGGRSSTASDFLSKQGFENVYNMAGGIREWMRLGYEIVQ